MHCAVSHHPGDARRYKGTRASSCRIRGVYQRRFRLCSVSINPVRRLEVSHTAGIRSPSHRHASTFATGPLTGAVNHVGNLGFPDPHADPWPNGSHTFHHTVATELDAKGVRVEHIAPITGHVLNKKAPVLQDKYVHKSASNVRKIQVEALPHYQPPVSLPVYVRGQFKERLHKEARMYP